MQPIKVSAKEYRWITDQAFPGYNKRSVTIEVSDKVCPYNTFWDGGSKNTYRAVRLEDGKVSHLITGDSPWTAVSENVAIPLESGIVIVEESIFQGKIMPLRLHIHPSNMARLLNPSSNGSGQ